MKNLFNINTVVKYSLCFLIIFLPLREILSLYLTNNIKLVSDTIIILMFLIGFIFKKIDFKINKLDILFILFLTIAGISTFINGYSLYTYLIQARSIVIYYFLYFILRNYKFKNEQIMLFTNILKTLTVILFLLAVVEIIFNKMILFPEIWATNIQYADNFRRCYSLFNNPNTFAIFNLFTFIYLKESRIKSNNIIINSMLISNIILSMSRSTILFLLIYIVYLFFQANIKKDFIKQILLIAILSFLTVFVINFVRIKVDYKNARQNFKDDTITYTQNDDDSFSIIDRLIETGSTGSINSSKYNGRLYSINKGLEIFKQYPILGTGFGTYGSSATLVLGSKLYNIYDIPEGFYADNDYIKVLVETGIIGFSLYLLICLGILINNKENWIICLIFLGYGLFLNNFETQALCLMFYLTLLSKNYNKKLKEKDLAIYALHLNYGGVERNITNLANILSEHYNVTIYTVYHLQEPAFVLNKNVKIQYLTEGIAPNKEEFLTNLKQFKPLKLFCSSLTALKVLYLKNSSLNKSLCECDAKIIISTRIDFSKKMVKYNPYNNIKIAHEHIYHNNDTNYLKDLEQILKNIDYLMPSSAYLTEEYQNLFPKYKNKIIQNKMPINLSFTDNNLTTKNIISVGRFSPEKGFPDLIKVFKRVSEKHTDWTLTIAGDGPERKKIEDLITQYNLEKKVNLLGNVKPQELDKIYQNSSIYIMTSYEESFGLVLLEAAHYSLPLVAFSTALGAKEIISENGVLIDNRDISKMSKEICKIIEDKSYRKKLGEKSHLIAQKYNYSHLKTELLDFYTSLEKKNIYSNLYKGTLNDFHKIINKRLETQEKTFIVTANPESYVISKKDNEVLEILNNKENLVVPDGISIVKTANYLGYNIHNRITGVELTEYLLKLANEKQYSIFLFGSSEEIVKKLNKKITEKYPNINILGYKNGYVKDKDKVMKKIKNLSPDIILVALGIPLQEKLINKHIKDFDKGLFIGIGGSFDVLSGAKKRAPKIFIKLNLEWLYRILKEPKRITRFLKYNVKFLLDINKEKNK